MAGDGGLGGAAGVVGGPEDAALAEDLVKAGAEEPGGAELSRSVTEVGGRRRGPYHER